MAYIQQYITESNAGMNSVAHLGRNIGGTIGVTVLQLSMTKNMLLLSISIMVIGYIGFMMALFLAKNKIYNVVGEEAQNG